MWITKEGEIQESYNGTKMVIGKKIRRLTADLLSNLGAEFACIFKQKFSVNCSKAKRWKY